MGTGHAIAAVVAMFLAVAPAHGAGSQYAATITRTAEGVAHISARDMAGLGYGTGYSAAEDNGCIIAETLVTVRGERAHFFGKGRVTVGFNDIPNLESDFFHRAIGDLPKLRKALGTTWRDNRALLGGFVAGYNRFLREHAQGFAADCRGAEWLRPMQPDDALLLVNAAMVQGSAAPYARFIAGAVPPAVTALIPAELKIPDPATQQGLGSNGWAFGSLKTANGRGILVGDPHFPWSGPNRFRRFHLTIPGRFDVMGVGLAASPYVAIGFNRDIAWTHTVATSQHLTLYQLDLDPADATRYLIDGKREPMTRREITVAVKDAPPVTRTLFATRYGPMIAIPGSGLGWTPAHAYAVRDADQGNFRSGDAWIGIARSHSVEQIREILTRTIGIPYVNTVAADRAGHALYADISAIPNLSRHKIEQCGLAQGSKPDSDTPALFILDGTHGGCAWDVDPSTPVAGLMPISGLPVMVRSDWVQNSNDSYWLTNPHAPFPELSPVLGPYATRQGLRTRSAIAVLEAESGKIDSARARALTLENRVEAARLVLDDLLLLCPQRPLLADACTALANWDRRAEVRSKGALLFFAFWRKAAAVPDFWAVPFDPRQPAVTPRGINPARAAPILDALQGAVAELAELKIPLDAPLGQFQLAPRGSERIAIHGGPSVAGVLNAMHSATAPEGLVPYHGSSYVQVVGFDDHGPVADSLLSYSQSSNPESPHFADGTHAYSEKRWLRLPWTATEIAAQAEAPPLTISE